MSWYCLSLWFYFLWACKYIQCTDLACHARFHASRIASESFPRLGRVHISVPVLWSSTSSLFRYVVYVIEAPSCSLNNVHTVQLHHVCRLASYLDVISDLCNQLASIKRLFLYHVVVCCQETWSLGWQCKVNRLLWAGVPQRLVSEPRWV